MPYYEQQTSDLQRAFDNVSDSTRKEKFKETDQITLGELIDLAESIETPKEALVRLDINHMYTDCDCKGVCICGNRDKDVGCDCEEICNCGCECRCKCAEKFCEVCEITKEDRQYWTVENPDSWRGIYKELAFDFVEESTNKLTLETFIKMLYEANGETYTGYKGGDFTMHRGTPVWVCWGYSCSGGPRGMYTAIVGLETINGVVVIKTKYIEEIQSDCVIS